MLERRHLAGSIVAIVATAIVPAAATAAPDLPCSTVRVVVPFGAGGGSDFQARLLVDAANRIVDGPQLQVVNITGQSGNRGTREVANADPDGCTLLYHHAGILSSYLTGRAPFTWEAFTPVAMIAGEPSLFAANASENYSNLEELAAYGEENPGAITAAVSIGSDSHFFMLQLQDALGVRFNIVGYDGTAERVTALLSGVIQITQVTEQTAAQYFGNQLTPLAFAGEERSDRVPDVPTAKEQGYDVVLSTTRGFLLPAGASDEVTDYYDGVFEAAVQDETVTAEFDKRGIVIDYRGPEAYRDWWQEAFERWKALAIDLEIYTPRQ
ncbi:tripartite tricarboxylate transporter substrate binding protein [Acuticoccus sp. M5D2P5]|uniref:tripartite tricarboxylate transporter substrate binding protein n=1 Tax=Acuticoccus kalidii TaxID=2910977 RepID=UPI001F29C5D4|nr:tripartite tricarboxylate transporter substrate binding protein [Acuticoccus kalidii]MCF3932683.1 tripartite tricarboxylate transporter substrate binding protein [Acuticoccus kalidii]